MNRVEIVDTLFNLKETTALLGFMVTAVEAGAQSMRVDLKTH